MSITREQIEKSRRVALRIPREVVEERKTYQERHELSLLELLIQAHPERAKLIIDRLKVKAA